VKEFIIIIQIEPEIFVKATALANEYGIRHYIISTVMHLLLFIHVSKQYHCFNMFVQRLLIKVSYLTNVTF
jgi:hypothetical protein